MKSIITQVPVLHLKMIGGAIFEGFRVLWSHRRETKEPIIHTGLAYYTPRIAAVIFFACACITTASHLTGGWTCLSSTENLPEKFVITWCEGQKQSKKVVTSSHPNYHDSTFMYFRWASLNLFFIAFSFGITASVWTAIEGK